MSALMYLPLVVNTKVIEESIHVYDKKTSKSVTAFSASDIWKVYRT